MFEIVERIKMMQEQLAEGAKKTDDISARIEKLSERISDAHKRVEEVGGRCEHVERQNRQLEQSLKDFTVRCGQDIDRAWTSMAELQADLQARDDRMDRVEEAAFHNAVTVERGLQECRDGLSGGLQTPAKGQVSESYQEHARNMEQGLEDLHSKMSEHEKKFHKGEKQTRQAQEEVADVKTQPSGGIGSTDFPARDEEWRWNSSAWVMQQVRFDRMQEDNAQTAIAIKKTWMKCTSC